MKSTTEELEARRRSACTLSPATSKLVLLNLRLSYSSDAKAFTTPHAGKVFLEHSVQLGHFLLDAQPNHPHLKSDPAGMECNDRHETDTDKSQAPVQPNEEYRYDYKQCEK